ncbi:hypothetical protein WR25_05446 [Diploscapter pachys]|uniref:Uncharacterized protein n=1 Tax=Diploscapter pachys TaxID=2018661 RepID=A0A2A2JWQ6_9BILA|nr:hypothetical protein WR25_05446 [Diploscapter pachys]
MLRTRHKQQAINRIVLDARRRENAGDSAVISDVSPLAKRVLGGCVRADEPGSKPRLEIRPGTVIFDSGKISEHLAEQLMIARQYAFPRQLDDAIRVVGEQKGGVSEFLGELPETSRRRSCPRSRRAKNLPPAEGAVGHDGGPGRLCQIHGDLEVWLHLHQTHLAAFLAAVEDAALQRRQRVFLLQPVQLGPYASNLGRIEAGKILPQPGLLRVLGPHKRIAHEVGAHQFFQPRFSAETDVDASGALLGHRHGFAAEMIVEGPWVRDEVDQSGVHKRHDVEEEGHGLQKFEMIAARMLGRPELLGDGAGVDERGLDDQLAEIERRTQREFDDGLRMERSGVDRARTPVSLVIGQLAPDRRPVLARVETQDRQDAAMKDQIALANATLCPAWPQRR